MAIFSIVTFDNEHNAQNNDAQLNIIQHKNTQYNDAHYNETQHKDA